MADGGHQQTHPNTPSDQEVRDNLLWASRPCFLYRQEFKDCKSIKGRFHQYFIFGENIDCSQWGRDYENCTKYEEKGDIAAGRELLASEAERRRKRMEAHYANDVWKKRTQPPSDWNAPLPEWFVKNNENSYLAAKSKEVKEGITIPIKEDSFCSIM
ncbi:UPF0545 protein C22orf39 homolog [Lutzomyia longipalpis]|uniref:Synaptic plasticity regulator PANTS n=1 Tax=Lutzomyia longipalpis TaxID=7200 RepID=A0A1B0CKZ6_LUTLO|nr:UPF0545 protein C22orf39 homolog [Lutzomyia longipalpis]